uniref:Peptidase S1 domain-containing protein n=1 Tax=Neogobius melanostomus TaxID=47308 RepID=A0A8C6TUE3_9GOBI
SRGKSWRIYRLLLPSSDELSRPCPLQPVLLPKPGMQVSANDQCSVVGWGSTQTKGSGSRHLRMANVSVIDHKILSFLVFFLQGDSGGPLVCNGTAVGIVSFNYLSICDYPTYPNVYTGLNKFLPWITNALAKNDC